MQTQFGLRRIGRGRSAVVYRDDRAADRAVVHKVFEAGGVAKLVHYVLSGAPNPYGWNDDAIAAAVARREILSVLVRFWFRGRLRLPRLHGAAWNDARHANELRVEFIDGTHVPLCSQNSARSPDPIDDLTSNIMPPLRRHLVESGFDGLVWQAGLGNPVAGGNFMIEHTTARNRNWVWIDLESGVPALFPINPLALASFYLPRSVRHGRPLFDDVDVPKLRRYIAKHREAIADQFGERCAFALDRNVTKLDVRQAGWKSMTRTERGIAYYRAAGRLDDAAADWYRRHPWRWHGRLTIGLARSAAVSAIDGIRSVARRIAQTNWLALARNAGRLLVSRRYRSHVARRYLARRLRDWRDRRFLAPNTARRLRAELRARDDGDTLGDFGVHLAIKPLVKATAWVVAPILFVLGCLAMPAFLAVLAAAGAICRTVYTAGRCTHAAARGERPPWVALVVGLFPGIGNAAFPAQLVYDARRSAAHLPQFILYDSFARLGRAVPVWGGRDSLVEGWFNRLPNFFMRRAVLPDAAPAPCGPLLEEVL
jgi:hypothetical protein